MHEAVLLRFGLEAGPTSPLYGFLSARLGEGSWICDLLEHAPVGQRKANLLFAAVHDLLLAGYSSQLGRYYASIAGEKAHQRDEHLFGAFTSFCDEHRDAIVNLLQTRHTQTNEPARAIALFPLIAEVCSGRPAALIELGSSAGLLTRIDQYGYRFVDGTMAGVVDSPLCLDVGTLPPPWLFHRQLKLSRRIGIDLKPIDPAQESDVRWLRACVWPEHYQRRQRLDIALAIASKYPMDNRRGHVVELLGDVIAELDTETTVVVMHSATMPYLGAEEQAAVFDTLRVAGDRREVHWVSLEGVATSNFGASLPAHVHFQPRATDDPTVPLALLAHSQLTPGRPARHRVVARANLHGNWVEWL